MANHKSAEKRIRQTQKRTQENRVHSSRMKTAIKKVEEAISVKDKTRATDALRSAQPLIVKAGNRNIIHPRTASRKISRLSCKIKAI